MFNGLNFATPLLLVGLLASAIPVVLHLLSAVRAPETVFPTLRFLRLSMEKTARRRRLEHWLLLLIRSLLLGLLAVAVAEPIFKSASGFLAGDRMAAVLVLDNSYSMTVPMDGLTRLEHARREAGKLLGGTPRPATAALLLTNSSGQAGGGVPDALSSDLQTLRDQLASARPAAGRADLATRVRQACELLKKQSSPQRAVYLFTDCQAVSTEGLDKLAELTEAGASLMLVDCSGKPAENVGIVDLQVAGERVVDRPKGLEVSATIANSSSTRRDVRVAFQVDGRPTADEPASCSLAPAGQQGSRSVVRFKPCVFTEPGTHVGAVSIADEDDLAVDNTRRFCVDVAGKIQVLLVRPAGAATGALDPGRALQYALDAAAGSKARWPVTLRTASIDQFDAAALKNLQAVYFTDVPSFTKDQADAVIAFVAGGGSAVFFLGPSISPDNYNATLVDANGKALLPGVIGRGTGQAGVLADAVKCVKNTDHRYLAGLYQSPSDYPPVLVQRYYLLEKPCEGIEPIFSTPAGDAILSARTYATGRVVLCTTTASAEWNNLSSRELFLPLAARIALESAAQFGADQTYVAGMPVPIRPRALLGTDAVVSIDAPEGAPQKLPLQTTVTGQAGEFLQAATPGVYRWHVEGAGPETAGASGTFVTNLDGVESDLSAVPAADLARTIPGNVYVGENLDGVHAAAANAAAGENLWDRVLVVVALLLVLEALVANRSRRTGEASIGAARAAA